MAKNSTLNDFHFTVLGCSMNLRSSSETVYMEQIAEHLTEKFTQAQHKLGLQDPVKIAVMSAFLLVDDLFQERKKQIQENVSNRQRTNQSDSMVREMIESLEGLL